MSIFILFQFAQLIVPYPRAAKLLEDQEALREMIRSAGEVKVNEEQGESYLRASDHGAAHSGA